MLNRPSHPSASVPAFLELFLRGCHPEEDAIYGLEHLCAHGRDNIISHLPSAGSPAGPMMDKAHEAIREGVQLAKQEGGGWEAMFML